MKQVLSVTRKQIISAFIGAGVMSSMLSSCDSLSDSANTLMQGMGMGTVGGAALGTGIGALVGGNDTEKRQKAMLTGAIVGGLVGAVAGHQWAKSVIKKKSEYANQESWIRDNIKQMDSRISDAKKLNNDLTKQIADIKKSNAALSKSDYAAIKKDVNQKVKYLDGDLATVKNNMKGEDISNADLATLNKKYIALQDERNRLLDNVALLGAANAAV